MSTPNESQLQEALKLTKEKSQLEKEIAKIVSQRDAEIAKLVTQKDALDAKIQKALGATPTAAPAAEAKPKTKKEPKAPKAKAPKAEKAEKPAKAAKAEKSTSTGLPNPKPGRHGQLRDAILNLLADKGPEGMKTSDIATATGRKVKNIYVWYSNIGSKIPGLSRPKEGFLAYAKPAEEAPAPPAAE